MKPEHKKHDRDSKKDEKRMEKKKYITLWTYIFYVFVNVADYKWNDTQFAFITHNCMSFAARRLTISENRA